MVEETPGHRGEVTIGLLVAGMHCQSCAALIEEVVADVVGVTSVRVDLARATSDVSFDPALVGGDQLCAVIKDLGYQASVETGSAPD